jgi:hypothetical protein
MAPRLQRGGDRDLPWKLVRKLVRWTLAVVLRQASQSADLFEENSRKDSSIQKWHRCQ